MNTYLIVLGLAGEKYEVEKLSTDSQEAIKAAKRDLMDIKPWAGEFMTRVLDVKKTRGM